MDKEQGIEVFNATDLVCPGLTTPVHKFCVMKDTANVIVVLVAKSQEAEASRKLAIMVESYHWLLMGPAELDQETVVFTVGKTDVGKGILQSDVTSTTRS